MAFKNNENKKLHFPSIEEGVELSQRAGQLSIVSNGEGHPRLPLTYTFVLRNCQEGSPGWQRAFCQ
jgi:hypothetical protein